MQLFCCDEKLSADSVQICCFLEIVQKQSLNVKHSPCSHTYSLDGNDSNFRMLVRDGEKQRFDERLWLHVEVLRDWPGKDRSAMTACLLHFGVWVDDRTLEYADEIVKVRSYILPCQFNQQYGEAYQLQSDLLGRFSYFQLTKSLNLNTMKTG